MDILTTAQRRVLSFVEACNRSGYRPTADEVKLWFDNPTGATTTKVVRPGTLTSAMEAFLKVVQQVPVEQIYGVREVTEEHPVDHLIRIKWITSSDDRLQLTRLGDALLMDSQREVAKEESPAVVLATTDRFAYARLIGEIAKLGEAYLVDPYFRLAQLDAILQTRVRRVLISKQYSNSKAARAELAVALATLSPTPDLEIRSTADPRLHDRVIVAETGDVFMLGGSLNTVGSANTIFMKVPASGASALKQQAEDLWLEAEPLTHAKPTEGEAEAS